VCKFSSDGEFLVSGSADCTLKIWDYNSGKQKKTLEGHIGEVYTCTISPDNKFVVSGSVDKTIKIWNIKTGEMKTFNGHTDTVQFCFVSYNNKYIISFAGDFTAKIWDFASGNEVKSINEISLYWAQIVCMSPNGKFIVYAFGDCTQLKILNLETLQESAPLTGNKEILKTISISSDGRWIIGNAVMHNSFIWDAASQSLVFEIENAEISCLYGGIFVCSIDMFTHTPVIFKMFNTLSSPEMNTKIYKEGTLTKQGHRIKNWKQRFFVLEGFHLKYYKKKGERDPKGVIPLKGCKIESVKSDKKFLFELVTRSSGAKHNTYLIYAQNKAELDEWLEAIQSTINNANM